MKKLWLICQATLVFFSIFLVLWSKRNGVRFFFLFSFSVLGLEKTATQVLL